jgi:hypothetical protein
MKIRHRRDNVGVKILIVAALWASLFGAVAMLFDYMLKPLPADMVSCIIGKLLAPRLTTLETLLGGVYHCRGSTPTKD